jgi:hypothetical protein
VPIRAHADRRFADLDGACIRPTSKRRGRSDLGELESAPRLAGRRIATIGMSAYVQVVCERAVVAGDRRRSHVIDVGRRLAGIDALKMYDRNDPSPVAGRWERQRRNEERSHPHHRENA